MEYCVDYAKDRKDQNLSVERIADLMGIDSHFTLYKWIANGRLPAIMIRPFENACGIDFVTRYLAHSSNRLLVPIPTGKKPESINELNCVIADAGALIARFYFDGQVEKGEVIAAITTAMEGLAFHRNNIEKNDQPELELM